MLPTRTRLYAQQDWNNDIPLKFLWTINISPRAGSFNKLASNINDVLDTYERTDIRRDWPVRPDVFDSQIDKRGGLGFLFANSVALPSDQFIIGAQEIKLNSGFIPGYYAGGRQAYANSNKLDITFLETNTDVLDYFIRPWIVANSHVGLIERGPGHPRDLKCNISLNLYTRDKQSYIDRDIGIVRPFATRFMQLRKTFMFYNAIPFVIQGGQLNYDNSISMDNISKTVAFTFSRYNTLDFTTGFR
jgi:hypothetical protein